MVLRTSIRPMNLSRGARGARRLPMGGVRPLVLQIRSDGLRRSGKGNCSRRLFVCAACGAGTPVNVIRRARRSRATKTEVYAQRNDRCVRRIEGRAVGRLNSRSISHRSVLGSEACCSWRVDRSLYPLRITGRGGSGSTRNADRASGTGGARYGSLPREEWRTCSGVIANTRGDQKSLTAFEMPSRAASWPRPRT